MVAVDRPIGQQQRWAYPLLLVVSGVALGVSGLPAPLYGIYESTWHLSPLATTVVFAVYALAALAAVLVSGRVSDVVGRKPVLLGALFTPASRLVRTETDHRTRARSAPSRSMSVTQQLLSSRFR